tara:strand:+ start:1783 stop:2175 length:393 start_codon:yes stop_codon:yes gene_type:complete
MEVNDNTNLTIPLRNLVALIFATAVAVLGYSELNSRLTTLEHGQTIQDMTIRENAAFVREWPLGLRGALPDDLIQNAKILALEDKHKEIDLMRERMNDLQIEINRAHGVDETQNQKIETIFDIWNQQVSE